MTRINCGSGFCKHNVGGVCDLDEITLHEMRLYGSLEVQSIWVECDDYVRKLHEAHPQLVSEIAYLKERRR